MKVVVLVKHAERTSGMGNLGHDEEPRTESENEFIVWTARGAQCLPIGGLNGQSFSGVG